MVAFATGVFLPSRQPPPPVASTLVCCSSPPQPLPLCLHKSAVGSSKLSRHTFSTTNAAVADAIPTTLLGDPDSPLSVLVEAKRERAGDVHLRASVKAVLNAQCDRCGEQFPLKVHDGRFEVWLATASDLVPSCGDQDKRTDEAVEDWRAGVNELDLVPHISDAILLGRPLKSLCTACRDQEETLPEVLDEDQNTSDPEDQFTEAVLDGPPTQTELEKLKQAMDRRRNG